LSTLPFACGTDEKAWIRVGPETRVWKQGECLLYDTTYEHETMNEHPTQERVVLHVDFFNTLALTPVEIEVMQYIYSLREEFMKADGVAKVGNQIL
jgi:aspartyl/asparaginyl beta-hydroxylase (cupin superfamily)